MRQFIRSGLVAATLTAAMGAPALGQEETPVADGPAWSVQCGQMTAPEPDAAPQQTCVMLQNLSLAQGDMTQRLLTVLIQPDGQGGRNMVLALPHGLLLPAGARYAIDGGEPAAVQIITSDEAGAYAPAPFTEELAQALSAGTEMQVSFQAANGRELVVPVTLDGFAQSYANLLQGVPTQ